MEGGKKRGRGGRRQEGRVLIHLLLASSTAQNGVLRPEPFSPTWDSGSDWSPSQSVAEEPSLLPGSRELAQCLHHGVRTLSHHRGPPAHVHPKPCLPTESICLTHLWPSVKCVFYHTIKLLQLKSKTNQKNLSFSMEEPEITLMNLSKVDETLTD